MNDEGLFQDLPRLSAAELQRAQAQADRRSEGAPRILEPNRKQIELRASDLESLLPEDHRARLVWGYVERQDLSALFDAIKARGAAPGRSAIDPRILFALWLYATLVAWAVDGRLRGWGTSTTRTAGSAVGWRSTTTR